jgi:hypothetical protein
VLLEKKNRAKCLTGISSNAVFIGILVNTPTTVKIVLAVKGLGGETLTPRSPVIGLILGQDHLPPGVS